MNLFLRIRNVYSIAIKFYLIQEQLKTITVNWAAQVVL